MGRQGKALCDYGARERAQPRPRGAEFLFLIYMTAPQSSSFSSFKHGKPKLNQTLVSRLEPSGEMRQIHFVSISEWDIWSMSDKNSVVSRFQFFSLRDLGDLRVSVVSMRSETLIAETLRTQSRRRDLQIETLPKIHGSVVGLELTRARATVILFTPTDSGLGPIANYLGVTC